LFLSRTEANLKDDRTRQQQQKGALRLRYRYTNEVVLPLPVYSKLLEVVMAENMEIVTIYDKVTDEREDAAKTLVRIMEFMNQTVPFINALNSTPPPPPLSFDKK